MKILPVIMAGGSGTRLWPLSRANFPKQFIQIFGSRASVDGTKYSLLQLTAIRVAKFGRPFVIVGSEHRFIAEEQLNQVGVNAQIILEPEGKNTAPCASLASILGIQEQADIVALLPADHFIGDDVKFQDTILEAASLASISNVCTIGIKPTSPHTGYGYIKLDGNNAQSFKEKPSHDVAAEYLRSGNYVWNSGIFLFCPKVMSEICEKTIPETTNLVKEAYLSATKDLGFIRLNNNTYNNITCDSIDYAIMEKIENITCIEGDFGWSDMGSFSSIWELEEKDDQNNSSFGDVILNNCSGSYVYSSDKLVAAVGLDDVIIVNTPDSVLVAPKSRSEEVKNLVSSMQKTSREEVANSAICYRPWGSYQTIDQGKKHKVKRIIVKPGHKLSLQYHNQRAEHWVVVMGSAEVEIDGKRSTLQENDSVYIPIGAKHRLGNNGQTDLHLIEVQTGNYLGEDDIVRLTDIYGR